MAHIPGLECMFDHILYFSTNSLTRSAFINRRSIISLLRPTHSHSKPRGLLTLMPGRWRKESLLGPAQLLFLSLPQDVTVENQVFTVEPAAKSFPSQCLHNSTLECKFIALSFPPQMLSLFLQSMTIKPERLSLKGFTTSAIYYAITSPFVRCKSGTPVQTCLLDMFCLSTLFENSHKVFYIKENFQCLVNNIAILSSYLTETTFWN